MWKRARSDSAKVKATDFVIQLFPDAEDTVQGGALTQAHKKHIKAKPPQMTSKPLRGTTLKGVCVDELITDMYVCAGLSYTHMPRQLFRPQELPSMCV